MFYVGYLAFSSLLCWVNGQRYIVPEATLEFLSPRGLKISIPDDNAGIDLVAYHINVNEEFEGLEHGHFGVDILKRKDGRWTYYIPDLKVKQGDVIYYWIHVVVDKLGYNGVDREYRVTQDPNGGDPSHPVERIPSCATQSNWNEVLAPGCPGEVLLDKRFNNMDGWSHRVSIGGSSPEDEFVVFTQDYTASFIENRRLVIRPELLEKRYNESFVRYGELLLEGCTSNVAEECARRAQHYLILPPVISARLNTKNTFSFRYGTVEIRAKLPRGDWIVPELWLEPVNGPQTERVVIGLSRGNMDDTDYGWRTLEAGVIGVSHSSLGKMIQDTPWSQDFHTFKLQWTPDQMIFTVDGQEIHRIPSVDFSILSKEVYVSLGVHVAGNRDFPENSNNKPWKTTDPKRFVKFWEDKKNWYSTWLPRYSSLKVEYVKITAV